MFDSKQPAPLAAAVLIGGRSARMGRPKHLLPSGGVTLIERMVEVVGPLVQEVVAAGAGDLPPRLTKLRRVADARSDSGPLAGVVAAMGCLPGRALLTLSCDLPWMTADALEWLTAQRAIHSLGTVPRSCDGAYHCLAAIYEPHVLPVLENLLERGMGPIGLLQSPDIHSPLVPPEMERCFADVDSPDDWARFEAELR